MIWVCGSGRCGTQSAAKYLDCPHEPMPWEMERFAAWTRFPKYSHTMTAWLEENYGLGHGAVVDTRFSYVLPLLPLVDRHRKIIALYRDPVETAASWLHRGNWDAGHGGSLPCPRPGWLESEDRVDKAIWFWNFVYRQILFHLRDEDEVWNCQYLTYHENRSPEPPAPLSDRDEERVRLGTAVVLGELKDREGRPHAA